MRNREQIILFFLNFEQWGLTHPMILKLMQTLKKTLVAIANSDWIQTIVILAGKKIKIYFIKKHTKRFWNIDIFLTHIFKCSSTQQTRANTPQWFKNQIEILSRNDLHGNWNYPQKGTEISVKMECSVLNQQCTLHII